MFDLFTQDTENDAIVILKRDHYTVKDLFDKFEKAEGRPAKRKLVKQALQELKIHAVLEEEIFYPAVRKHVGVEVIEADEEHHVAKVLIAELDKMDGQGDHFEAKFMVLAENVRHHIKEEEGEMLPKAKSLKMDFVRLGEQMLRRKKVLIARGVPPFDEQAMVAAVKGTADSPAKAARKKTSPVKKRRAA